MTPTSTPSLMPSPIPTTSVPSTAPTIEMILIDVLFNFTFAVAETTELLSSAQVKVRAIGFAEAICFERGFAVVVEDATIAAYLDAADAIYPSSQTLSLIETNCTVDSAVGAPSTSGTIVSQAIIVACETYLIYEEARTASDFTTTEIIDKLTTFYEETTVGNADFPSSLETAILTEAGAKCASDFATVDTTDIDVSSSDDRRRLDRQSRRRRLIGGIGSISTAAVSAVSVSASTTSPTTLPTSAPTTLPTSAPTAIPTSAPTAMPMSAPTAIPTISPSAAPSEMTCFSDSDCPSTQVCSVARRRKLSFGSLSGTCQRP